MQWLWCLVVAVLVVAANGQLLSPTTGDYEIWAEGKNITANLTDPDFNDTVCPDYIKLNLQMEDLVVPDPLTTAFNLKALVADGNGLKRLTKEALAMVPISVKNLTIVNNNIKKINSGVFSNFTFERLNLSYNHMESIAPDAFNYMPNLTSINLDHNELTTYNITFLECPKLKVISLKYNFIKRLADGIMHKLKTNILSIYMSYNTIKDIHKSALDVKQFHEVHLDHNELSNAQLLIKLVKAEVVDLSVNQITCLPKEFMENGLSKIKLLNLTGNPLECHCLHDLQRKVRKNIEFQKMSPLVSNINIVLPKQVNKTCEKS